MSNGTTLSPEETARYSRHILLPEIDVAGQERLKAARVLVVGAGGLGSPAALYLAAAGVGTIGLADFDRVELHNLQRQVLHGTSSVGQPKTASGAAHLRELNPHVSIVEHTEGVHARNAVELFARYDLIVDGSDNFPTRYLNTDAAFFARRPLVYGSIFKFEGQVTVFDPHGGGPCYRCLFPEPPPPGSVPNCGEAGVLGALCGVIGSLQAMEAIKRLAGIASGLAGRLLVVDALTMTFRSLNLRKDPECPLCGPRATIRAIEPERYAGGCGPAPTSASAAPVDDTATVSSDELPLEIDVQTAAQLARRGAVIVDVREPFEWEKGVIEGSRLIALGEIRAHLDELSRDQQILIICESGTRASAVTSMLRRMGYNRVEHVAPDGMSDYARRFPTVKPVVSEVA